MINQVTLAARVVSEIALRRTTKKGVNVCDFRVMHSDRKLANALFIDVEVWGAEAERVSTSVRRGDNVLIVGELRRDVWTTKTEGGEGETRSKIKITAHRVVVSGTPEKRRSQDDGELRGDEGAF